MLNTVMSSYWECLVDGQKIFQSFQMFKNDVWRSLFVNKFINIAWLKLSVILILLLVSVKCEFV